MSTPCLTYCWDPLAVWIRSSVDSLGCADRPCTTPGLQNIAASLMPAIGAERRNSRLPAKPSDAELKEAIAQLQKSTARAAPASGIVLPTFLRQSCRCQLS